MKRWSVALGLGVPLLTACGGGGGNSGSDEQSDVQEVTVAQVEGIGDLAPGVYEVYTENVETGVPAEGSRVDALVISDTGRTVRNLLNIDHPLRFGTAKFESRTDFDWSEELVSWRNLSITDQPTQLPGSVSDANTFVFAGTSSPEPAFLAVRLSRHTEPAITLEELSGSYTGGHHLRSDGRRATFTIDSNGVVTGADDKGCVFNGQVSNLESNYRVFDIDFEASNCQGDDIPASERNGRFTGVGILNAFDGRNDLIFYTRGESFAYTFTSA